VATDNFYPNPTPAGPESDLDMFCDDVLLDPYPHYAELREMGSAVWLNRIGMYIMTRFDDVQNALADWQTFTSAQGVTMNDHMNEALQGGVLCSDDPEHAKLRKILMAPLQPKELAALRGTINAEAEGLVDRLVEQKHFDAATELAEYLPITIVSELVGLPESGRERMLEWAPANFDCFGPENERTQKAMPVVSEMLHFALTECVPGKLKPGGWAAKIWEAADRGEIPAEQCAAMMNDYMGPSLDTTIFATGAAIMLFATHPDQWDLIRENPSLIPNAINEVIRIESPIQVFSRVATKAFAIDDIVIPQNARVLVSYGAANRDPRKWQDPDCFDVRRRAMDQLGFGHGIHQCLGNNLARAEISALLKALAKRVKRFELNSSKRHINNVLRGFASLNITTH